jgi:hypothetical protein
LPKPPSKGGCGESPGRHCDGLAARADKPPSKRERGFAVCGGKPAELAIADWLEELAVYGTARNPLDMEIAYQLSLIVENSYLVKLAIGYRS